MPLPSVFAYNPNLNEGIVECPVAFYAKQNPARPAVRTENGAVSYGELDGLISGARKVLNQSAPLAKTPQVRVAIWSDDPLDMLVWMFASFRENHTVFLPSTRLPPEALQPLLIACRSSIFVSRSRLSAVPWIDATLRSDTEHDSATLHVESPAVLLQTSGSIGLPKIAVLSLGNLLSSAAACNSITRVKASDSWYVSLPLYHVGGLGIVFRTLSAGATLAFSRSSRSLMAAVDSFSATHISLVTTQLRRFLQEVEQCPDTLREILVGGGPVPPGLIRDCVARQIPVRTTYGMTEMGSQITTSNVWKHEQESYSSGNALPHVDIRVGADAQIEVRGASRFMGYLNAEGDLDAIGDGAWFKTGDIGSLDGDEWTVLGRVDNLFISGGENVSPEEIEAHLLQFGSVEAVVVAPVPSHEYGARPVAFVQFNSAAGNYSELRDFLEQRLPRYKHPDRFLPWPEHVDTKSAKIDRKFFSEIAASL